MTAKLAPTGAPTSALRMWMDHRYIYAEIPGPVPHIMSFAITEGGMTKALNILRERQEFSGTAPTPARKLVGTPLQHAIAQKILRQKGLIR